MSKKTMIFGEVLLWGVAIWIGISILYYIICAEQRNDHYKWHEYNDIRYIRYLLQQQLDSYVKDEGTLAIADTDEKIRAYKNIDEIIEAAYNYKTLPDDEDVYFEKQVASVLTKFIKNEKNARYYIEPRSKDLKDCRLWIWIQGSYEEGYEMKLLPYKTDPFSEVRQ